MPSIANTITGPQLTIQEGDKPHSYHPRDSLLHNSSRRQASDKAVDPIDQESYILASIVATVHRPARNATEGGIASPVASTGLPATSYSIALILYAWGLKGLKTVMECTPKWIAWEITRRCNLHCVHCRSSSEFEVADHPDFSFAEAKRILEEIRSYANPVMVLSGGEPLLRPDVFDIAAHGTDLGLRMCLATNGSLVTGETCRHIKESGIKMVSLSLDGASAAVHDNFRNQPGAYAGVMNAIRLFNEHSIDFLINSSFTKRNKDEAAKIYPLVKSLGATAWYLFMIVPTGRGEEIMAELIPADEYEDMLNWHYDMEKEEPDLLVRPTCAPQYYRIVLQRSKLEGERFQRRSLKFSTGGSKGCLAGQLICLIDVDGNVLPCSYFPLAAGNLRTRSFRDIWEKSDLFLDLRNFAGYGGSCGRCEYVNVCGGCRARAYAVTGDYLAAEPFCTYQPGR